MAPRAYVLVTALAAGVLAPAGVATTSSRPALFVHPPADPSLVGAIVPRGNVNPGGGHIRPVKHMYLNYVTPRDGGATAVDLYAMATGRVALVYHRESIACLMPVGPDRTECADVPGATTVIDEYGVWIQHTDQVTTYYDHLHALDPELAIPDWRSAADGWVTIGLQQIYFPGLNGAGPPSRVRPGQRLGVTRSYFTSWDLGVVDTDRVGDFLARGRLRYPTLSDLLTAFVSEGGSAAPVGPGEPFPGEMFLNSACFLDYLTPMLAAGWASKLLGDGSCGRAGWDRAGALLGNWFRAEVVGETLANMAGIEGNAMSFSPYNLDPTGRAQIAIGGNYLAALPPASDATELGVRAAIARGWTFVPDRAAGALRNPDPSAVAPSGYACFDVPDGPSMHGLLVWYDGAAPGHLRLLHRADDCGLVLSQVTPANLPGEPWMGDYVR